MVWYGTIGMVVVWWFDGQIAGLPDPDFWLPIIHHTDDRFCAISIPREHKFHISGATDIMQIRFDSIELEEGLLPGLSKVLFFLLSLCLDQRLHKVRVVNTSPIDLAKETAQNTWRLWHSALILSCTVGPSTLSIQATDYTKYEKHSAPILSCIVCPYITGHRLHRIWGA